MANDDIIQVISDAREDAVSLSQFMYYPATVTVNRRLAPPIHTLNYYLQYLEGLEKVYSQPTGTVDVNGEVVKTVRQAINDAVDSAILGEYQTQLDAEISDEVSRAIIRENDIEDALEAEVIRASGAEGIIAQDVSDLSLDVDAQKFDTGITATAKFGGVERSQSDVNADTVSVEDFGASTSNSDNTTQINNAISYALYSNSGLYFPSGDFLTLGNLPDIHSVSVYGKGVIKKGDNNYYIEPSPTQQNILYVKPSGSGDGLSRDKAMGIPQLVPALRNVQDRAKLGSWRVVFCGGSGIFSADGIRLEDVPSFNNRLEFVGELTFAGLHDTIWDGSTSSQAYAIRADMNSAALRVLIKDIKIINFNSHPTNSGGLVFWGGHNLITENVSIDNCPIGIWTSRNSFHRSIGDKINNCAQWGIACQYNSSVALGLSAKRTKITNCKFGLHVGRVSVAHNDYADYENNDYDLYVTQNSRITHIDPTYKGWNIASHYMQNGAIDEAVEVGSYDSNSITDATPILLTENAPVVDIVKGRGLELLHQSQVPTNAAVVTGTTAQTLLSAMDGFNAWLRLPKNILYQGEGLTIRYKAYIQGVNTTDTSEFSLHGSGTSTSLQLISFPLPNGGYGGFIEVHIDFRKDGAMYVYGSMTTTYGVVYRNKTISPSTANANFRDKTSDLALWRTYLKPAATADTFTLLSQKTWITL